MKRSPVEIYISDKYQLPASPLTDFLCPPNGSERFFDGEGDADAAFCFSTSYLRFIHQLESSIGVTQFFFLNLSKKVNLRLFEKSKKLKFLKFERKLKYLSKSTKLRVNFDLRFIREIQARFAQQH